VIGLSVVELDEHGLVVGGAGVDIDLDAAHPGYEILAARR
jgi:hypothetical protein